MCGVSPSDIRSAKRALTAALLLVFFFNETCKFVLIPIIKFKTKKLRKMIEDLSIQNARFGVFEKKGQFELNVVNWWTFVST